MSGSPSYDQNAYRWRNDDGSETTATWFANENTSAALSVDTNYRIRLELENVGTANASPTFELRYSHNGGAYTLITTSSSVVRAVDSANLTDLAATTNQLTTSGLTFSAGQITEDGTTGSITLNQSRQTEVELPFQIIGTDVNNADTINIRAFLSGGAALNTYTQTAAATVSKASLKLGATALGGSAFDTNRGSLRLANTLRETIRSQLISTPRLIISADVDFQTKLILRSNGSVSSPNSNNGRRYRPGFKNFINNSFISGEQ